MKMPEWLKTAGILGVAFLGDIIAATVGSKIAHGVHPDPKMSMAKGFGQALGEALRKQTEFDRHELERSLAWLEAEIGRPSAIKQLLKELINRSPFEIGGKFYTENELSRWLADILRLGGKKKGRNELHRLESMCTTSREAFVAEFEIVHHDGVLQVLQLWKRMAGKGVANMNANWQTGIGNARNDVEAWRKRHKAKADAIAPGGKTPAIARALRWLFVG